MTAPRSRPGPRNALLQTVRFLRDPVGLVRECAHRYGDPFSLPLIIGRSVITGDPELNREGFGADPDLFEPVVDLLASQQYVVAAAWPRSAYCSEAMNVVNISIAP